jgi:hypothetical protein
MIIARADRHTKNQKGWVAIGSMLGITVGKLGISGQDMGIISNKKGDDVWMRRGEHGRDWG